MRRAITTFALSLALTLALAANAFAGDNGMGWIGEADDKTVTFFGLGLVILFPLVALVGSFIQGRLERRAQARKDAIFRSSK
ncbi:MAG: hypothetical protein HY827_07630 [Actinobacteria bacterium]|nr:hypothetical protein [Actinomycetota bacterium]